MVNTVADEAKDTAVSHTLHTSAPPANPDPETAAANGDATEEDPALDLSLELTSP